MKPNLFNYATSELSQDAIICWLLEWARIDNEIIDKKMHKLGVNFIDSFFNKFENINKPEKYINIEIKKQYKNIDILCIINNEFAILIEDKTSTKNHSGQLEKYLKEVEEIFHISKILPIYFKTGDQSSYKRIIEKGYAIYLRTEFLKVLNSTAYDNEILTDYHMYLQDIEDSVNSYKKFILSDWKWNSWKGFYIELKKELKEGNWDYVANPSGGFLGFWWHFMGNNECQQYLQIESKYNKKISAYDTSLCIKISVANQQDRKRLRKYWYEKIKNKSDDLNLKFKKPSRFGSGKYMTILVLENDYREVDQEGIVDIKSTVQYLHKVKSLINDVQENH